MKRLTTYSLLIIGLIAARSGLSQDIETFKDRKFVEYGGGVSATTTFYDAAGIANRRDPFYWQLSANLNFSFLGGLVQAPFSMTLSQQSKSISQPQPFNRFGISPKYKGLTVHLGHRSLNFSSYTLAGNLFFGVGVEYKPESNPLRVSAVYGRFAKAVAKSAQQGVTYADPTFQRIGYGVKLGFEKNQQQAHVIMFTAHDDPASVPQYDSLGITPEENLVLGFVSAFKIKRRIAFNTDYAYSLYNSNSESPEVFIEKYTFVNNLGGLFTPNSSSSFTKAFTTSLAYQGDGFQITGKYRRIDPNFTTLGSSYLNNDLEDVSGAVSFPVFNKKVTLNTSLGVQRNNLNQQLTTNLRRVIFSGSLSWMANEKLQVMANYGNYNSSTTQVQIQTDVLVDSLEFYQVSQNGTLNVNYAMGKGKSPLTTSWLGSIQNATDSDNNNSLFLSSSLTMQKRFGEWSVSFAGSANRNTSNGINNLTAGPVSTVSRAFKKGVFRTSFTTSLQNVYTDAELQSKVLNFRLNGSIKAGEKHNVSVSAFWMNKFIPASDDSSNVRETRGTITYNYRL